MIKVKFLHPRANWEHLGFIPDMLSENNPKSATQQLNDGYQHGGGWTPFNGHALLPDNSIKYPGDPPHKPIAEMRLRDELILIYEHSWVAVIQPDRSYEICRMD